MDKYLQVEYETTLRDIDVALKEFHIELPDGGAAHRDHGVHLLVEQLRRAESEIARLQAERRWIPVAERLPEEGGRYLVIREGGWHEIMLYDAALGKFIKDVTHWQPLLAGPTEAAE